MHRLPDYCGRKLLMSLWLAAAFCRSALLRQGVVKGTFIHPGTQVGITEHLFIQSLNKVETKDAV